MLLTCYVVRWTIWLLKYQNQLDKRLPIPLHDPIGRFFFAINTQATFDSKNRFRFVSCRSLGSTHDSTAFPISNLSRLLEKDEDCLSRRFWTAGDDAYTCMKRLLTLWSGRSFSISKNPFNYWQSSVRIYIEQAFGILVSRMGVL